MPQPPNERGSEVMSAVVVVVTLRAQQGKEEEMAELLTAGSAETHGEEGCLVYAMHRGVDDAASFAIVESWASREHLDAHLALPEVGEFIQRIDGMADGQPAFGVYEGLPAGDPQKGTLARA
jgi:quinol monooxygenase YgiN